MQWISSSMMTVEKLLLICSDWDCSLFQMYARYVFSYKP